MLRIFYNSITLWITVSSDFQPSVGAASHWKKLKKKKMIEKADSVLGTALRRRKRLHNLLNTKSVHQSLDGQKKYCSYNSIINVVFHFQRKPNTVFIFFSHCLHILYING